MPEPSASPAPSARSNYRCRVQFVHGDPLRACGAPVVWVDHVDGGRWEHQSPLDEHAIPHAAWRPAPLAGTSGPHARSWRAGAAVGRALRRLLHLLTLGWMPTWGLVAVIIAVCVAMGQRGA